MALFVSGFGRCGSSLTMQMLHAGGMQCAGRFPDFEDQHTNPTRSSGTPIDAAWLAGFADGAVKLLDPHRFTIPPGEHKAIWLERDHKEQGRSQAKFAHLMLGVPTDRQTARRFAKSYRHDKVPAIRALLKGGVKNILALHFEDLIYPARRRSAVREIVDYVGLPLNESAMLDAVIERDDTCAPGLEIELALAAKAEAAA